MGRRSLLASLAIAALVAVFAATDRPVAIAPIVAVAGVAITEQLLGHWRLRRLRLTPAAAPTVVEGDAAVQIAIAARPRVRGIAVAMSVEGRARSVDLGRTRLTGDRLILPWSAAGACVIRSVTVTLEAGSVGLWPARRTRTLKLPSPVYRGPALVEPPVRPVTRPNEISNLRDYRPGDRSSRVHWAATARTGTLQVRAEDRAGADVVVVVDEGPGPRTSDDAWLRLAGGYISAQQRSGTPVRLVTRQDDGTGERIVDAYVRDTDDLLRRLAAVAPGPPIHIDDAAHVFSAPAVDR